MRKLMREIPLPSQFRSSGSARPRPSSTPRSKPNFKTPLRRRHVSACRLSHSTPPCRAEPRRAVHRQCDALQRIVDGTEYATCESNSSSGNPAAESSQTPINPITAFHLLI